MLVPKSRFFDNKQKKIAETLSFFLEFWVFSLSYWVFFLNLLKSSQFPLKNWLFLPYFSLKWGILAIFQTLQCISPLFGSIFVVIFSNFAETLSFLLEFWVFHHWVLSFFLELWSILCKPCIFCLKSFWNLEKWSNFIIFLLKTA